MGWGGGGVANNVLSLAKIMESTHSDDVQVHFSFVFIVGWLVGWLDIMIYQLLQII